MIIESPLEIWISHKDKFILNLNNYRNAHYQILNKAKKHYKEAVREQIELLEPMDRVHISYVLFPKTKRLCDIGNIISIHKKFFEDALVEFGKLPDDNYQHIIGSSESFGHVDKDNSRVMIGITQPLSISR